MTMVRMFIHVSACYTQTFDLNISDSAPMPREISTPQSAIQNCVCSYEYYAYYKKNFIFTFGNPPFIFLRMPLCPGFRVLCRTRWTVHAASLKSVLDNYGVLQTLWDEAQSWRLESEMRARIIGVAYQTQSFEFLFGVCVGKLLLIQMMTIQPKRLWSAFMAVALPVLLIAFWVFTSPENVRSCIVCNGS